ncbi:MAG: Hpt domain-containing protein [Sphingopyxis sp.]
MPNDELPLVDWAVFAQTRAQLGTELMRILGYFVEDGLKSIDAVEDAMRGGNSAGLISPAHKLKSEARQFGGERLGQLAEDIEMFGRACVESRETPETYVDRVVALRPMFAEMLQAIDEETNPLVQRHAAGASRRAG